MARQKSILKLKGNIGDLSFFKTKRGYQVREKTGIDPSRIAHDPTFERTRENNREFGDCAKAGGLLRRTVRPMLVHINDFNMVQRLMRIMTAIRKYDTVSVRGQRKVSLGLAALPAKNLLRGFDFSESVHLGLALSAPYALNTTTGSVSITTLTPATDLTTPPGATHASLKCAWARIDFASGIHDIELSPVTNFPLNNIPLTVTLTPGVPAGTGIDLFLLKVEFYQEANGVQYSLKNGQYNALGITEVL